MSRHPLSGRSRSKKLTYIVTGGLTAGVLAATGAYAFASERGSDSESTQVKLSHSEAKATATDTKKSEDGDGYSAIPATPGQTLKICKKKHKSGHHKCTPPSATVTRPGTTAKPSVAPTTVKPSVAPTTVKPTVAPTTVKPTVAPTTVKPTVAPTTVAPKPTASATPTTSAS
jgi:hypothetical protein